MSMSSRLVTCPQLLPTSIGLISLNRYLGTHLNAKDLCPKDLRPLISRTSFRHTQRGVRPANDLTTGDKARRPCPNQLPDSRQPRAVASRDDAEREPVRCAVFPVCIPEPAGARCRVRGASVRGPDQGSGRAIDASGLILPGTSGPRDGAPQDWLRRRRRHRYGTFRTASRWGGMPRLVPLISAGI